MKKIIFFIPVLFFITYPVGALTLTDALGREVKIAAPAQRIVSLSPSVTEILFAIGAGASLVGRTEYCDYPEETKAITVVGGFSGATVSIERIALVQPTLVLISADMHERLVSPLSALGLGVFAVEPRTFEQVFSCIEKLGLLTGHEREARALVQKLQEDLAAIPRPKKAPRVFWVISDQPLMTAGKKTFIHEIIERAGGINIFADESRGTWFPVSPEEVLLRKPSLIVSGSDLSLAGFSFFKNIRKVSLDPSLVYRYGPRLIDAVWELARSF